jgi:hypothetical protein
VYARVGLAQVKETIPEWRGGKAELVVTVVKADSAFDAMLDKPKDLFEWLKSDNGGNAGALSSRIHACAMLAAEIHDAAVPPDERASVTRIKDTFEKLCTVPRQARPRLPTWAAGGPCTGLRPPRGQAGRNRCVGDGTCFPMQIESAAYRGKDSLCRPCVEKIQSFAEMRRLRIS